MRFRPWHIALVVVAFFSAACGVGGVGSQANDSESSAAPSVLIQHVQSDWNAGGKTIKPTAIVLHWWAGWDNGHNIDRLVKDAKNNKSTYNPDLKKSDPHPVVGHVTVQVGVTADGKAYQLTPQLNTFARHAKCANSWAIGIEIEGSEPGSGHYIGDNQTQFKGVVAVVKELMAKYDIKPESVVADDGRSGRGIVSHKQVDAKCKWADNKPAGDGKTDVDDAYLDRVLAKVK
ncbi:MAG TPA: N-acetylmuramoyl-L-alanine amidase [Candidatus Saccharimonadales bacterium]|nr:N-acetylmuramoyl-L-alanine amidase [Candidatus Saccharimonadales bacterium]